MLCRMTYSHLVCDSGFVKILPCNHALFSGPCLSPYSSPSQLRLRWHKTNQRRRDFKFPIRMKAYPAMDRSGGTIGFGNCGASDGRNGRGASNRIAARS